MMLIFERNDHRNLHDCPYCRWWDVIRRNCTRQTGCMFEKKMSPEDTLVKPKRCDGCPYGRGGICIGWCTRKIVEKEAVTM